jgi:hypothetical protein
LPSHKSPVVILQLQVTVTILLILQSNGVMGSGQWEMGSRHGPVGSTQGQWAVTVGSKQ